MPPRLRSTMKRSSSSRFPTLAWPRSPPCRWTRPKVGAPARRINRWRSFAPSKVATEGTVAAMAVSAAQQAHGVARHVCQGMTSTW